MAIAGRVAIVPKGAYSETATYKKLDLVTYNEAAYIAKRESTGIEPTDGDDWMLLVSTDLTEIRNEISDIADGSTVVGKAESDGDGNKIPDTYLRQDALMENLADNANEAQYNLFNDIGDVTTDVSDASFFVCSRVAPNKTEGALYKRKATTVWAWIKSKIESVLGIKGIANNLITNEKGYALDARQGAVLLDKIGNIKSKKISRATGNSTFTLPYMGAGGYESFLIFIQRFNTADGSGSKTHAMYVCNVWQGQVSYELLLGADMVDSIVISNVDTTDTYTITMDITFTNGKYGYYITTVI